MWGARALNSPGAGSPFTAAIIAANGATSVSTFNTLTLFDSTSFVTWFHIVSLNCIVEIDGNKIVWLDTSEKLSNLSQRF